MSEDQTLIGEDTPMNEAYLRKWHRRMGSGLAVFIFLQALSGLVLNFEALSSLPTLACGLTSCTGVVVSSALCIERS